MKTAIDQETCSICYGKIDGHGNNARPLASGRCCDNCNALFVVPVRILRARNERR